MVAEETNPAANLQETKARAASAKAGLVAEGMNAAEICDQGAGETRPIASNDTEQDRKQNRRVVIVVAPPDANWPDANWPDANWIASRCPWLMTQG